MRLRRPSCVFSETLNCQLRRTTNEHEWTRRPMDLLGCGDVTGGRPTRERGRPARTTLAQPHPSLPPGSTGNGATIPLRPSPRGSRRQGGRAPHHGETERPPNAEDAGETPALPVGRLLPSFLLRQEALPLSMRQSRPAWWPFVDSSFFSDKAARPGMASGSRLALDLLHQLGRLGCIQIPQLAVLLQGQGPVSHRQVGQPEMKSRLDVARL